MKKSGDQGNTDVNNSKGKDSDICITYTTKNNSKLDIADSEQIYSSYKTFHSKYIVECDIFEDNRTTVFIGNNKISKLKVAIKRFKVKDYKKYLKEKMPAEVFHQNKAVEIKVKNVKARVLKVLDWYVYDQYIVFVTEYDENFKDLFEYTMEYPDTQFSENECKIIFKLLFDLVLELNNNGIFHLDLKPGNVLYNQKTKEIRLIDFGHATSSNPGENPTIGYCGTKPFRTPQCAKKEICYGKDADLWGVAQTIFCCLQSEYAFPEEVNDMNKGLKFKVEVSQNCKDLFTRMLAYNVGERMTPQEIDIHPWLKEN